MKMPKAKIEISLTGKQTREIALSTIGRSSDKPLRTIAFMGLDNRWHFFGKNDKDLLFKNPAKNEYEIILNNEKIAVSKDVWEDFRHVTAGLERTEK